MLVQFRYSRLQHPLPSAHEKWFKEDFEWEIEVTGFLCGSETDVI